MNRSVLAVLAGSVLVAATPASPRQVEWTDPSSHVVRFVPVDTDVQLEVLDWGGSGPALVLLAGLGDTAHVFDEFALRLTARHRVVGVTRRAHGRSSAPSAGYGFARLAEDIARVIDAVGLDRPVVVGHSYAGDEMHVLGARHSGRIAGLVYVDAAFDRGDDTDAEAYNAVARTLPAIPNPGPADRASYGALRAFMERSRGLTFPEAYLRFRWVANADGTIARMWAPAPPVFQVIASEMQAAYRVYNPERIRVPALAIYAAPKSAGDLMRPWYDANDSVIREGVERLYPLERGRFAHHAQWFAAFAAQGRVSELAGAHHLFISNAAEVADQINEFAARLR